MAAPAVETQTQEEPDAKPKPPPKKRELTEEEKRYNAIVKKATTVKVSALKVMSAGKELVARVNSSPDFVWARSDAVLGCLSAALNSFNDALGDFGQDMMVFDFKTMESRYNKDRDDKDVQWDQHLNKFSALNDMVLRVKKETSTILLMHKQRS